MQMTFTCTNVSAEIQAYLKQFSSEKTTT